MSQPWPDHTHDRTASPPGASRERPIRVALVAPTIRILGGHAVQALRLMRGWAEDDGPAPRIEPWLVPVDPPLAPPFRRLTNVRYARTIARQLTYWPMLARELARADVVHVFSASYWSFVVASWPAVTVAHRLGKPVLLNYRSGEAPDHLRRSAFARRVLANVETNVVPSGFLEGVFAAHGLSAEVVPNTVDLSEFEFRRRDPLRPVLLSTRNFEPLYNVACTLRAFRRVQDVHPQASLTLVGSGTEEGALRALASELRLRNVTFAGRVPPSEIARFYAAADIYVQTPDIDNMPTSVLEAHASGLPVVSTRAGGVPFICRDGIHGLLADCGDAEAIANHVLRLLADQSLANDIVLAAREACEAYTWTRVREEWRAIYARLAGRAIGRSREEAA